MVLVIQIPVTGLFVLALVEEKKALVVEVLVPEDLWFPE